MPKTRSLPMLKQCRKWSQARLILNSVAQPASQNTPRRPGLRSAMPKSVPPWRSAAKPAAKIATMAKSAKNSAAKPVAKNGGSAIRVVVIAYEDDKEYLDQTNQEIRSVWHDVFHAEECVVCERISWRSCWGKLQAVLSGIYSDLLHGMITSLPDASRQKLVDIAGLLKAKLLKHHDKSVLLSRANELLQCMEELATAVIDTASWHMRLHELLCYEGGSAIYHKAQGFVIEKRLDDAQKRVKDVAARGQKIGVGGAIAETPHHY